MNIIKGQIIEANVSSPSSHYQQVIGTVEEVKSNGFISIRATKVINKWSDTYKDHPSSCSMSVKTEDVIRIVMSNVEQVREAAEKAGIPVTNSDVLHINLDDYRMIVTEYLQYGGSENQKPHQFENAEAVITYYKALKDRERELGKIASIARAATQVLEAMELNDCSFEELLPLLKAVVNRKKNS